MHHGCYHRCPKVREQLEKARAQAGEQSDGGLSTSDFELSNLAGSSKVQQAEATSKRSKESRQLPPGAASHPKIVKSPSRSHESAYQQNEQYLSGRASPNKSANVSRKFDPENRSQRRSKESHRTKEYLSRPESHIRSPEASVKFDLETKVHRRSQENVQPSSQSSRINDRGNVPKYDPANKSNKKSQRKGREFDDGAGPSGKRGHVEDYLDEFEDYEESYSAHDLCDSHCRGINERMRKLRDENQRQALDEYLVYKGLPYFGDLCICSCQCLVNQLWNDHFVNTTVTSFALFVVGLKLCSDLKGWTIPNVF